MLMPHVAPLKGHALGIDAAGKALVRLVNQACGYLMARGDRAGAVAMAKGSVALARLTEADDPLQLATCLANLGARYAELDKLKEAEEAYREGLKIEEPRLDPNDPSLAITLANIGGVHLQRKEFAKAEPLVLRAAGIMKTAHGVDSAEYATLLSDLGALYGAWAEATGDAARWVQGKQYMTQALTVCLSARGSRHPDTATNYANLAAIETKLGDRQSSERAVAIMLSLDLAQHPNTLHRANELAHFWEQSGQPDKVARLRSGDLFDLLPVIANIETEHRTWVADDPENRRFGPPSFFEPKNEEHLEQLLSGLAAGGVDMDDLMCRIQSGELSRDDFAKLVAEHLARRGPADTQSE
jgi:tetratricopeptide (TPR) repeat protein